MGPGRNSEANISVGLGEVIDNIGVVVGALKKSRGHQDGSSFSVADQSYVSIF